MPKYLVRTRREYVLQVEAADADEAVRISQDVDIKDWEEGGWEAAEADDDE